MTDDREQITEKSKRKMIFRGKKGASFIELLLALGIVIFLYYLATKLYIKKPSLDKNTQKALTEQGVDISSGKSTLENITDKISEINKKQLERAKKLEELQ
ncbi:MAG: hypothetical protein FJZ16_06430 [Candidatus Omnitrophica bacterium]|nr:hypothetical protein [Candidatus Omnitrophota bacterium]